ncbi:hypothetical protein G4X40_18570 [Rhodococcus sp. D2-41]|uniref:hypothetical protein n=1 Tax=Speluncibacter jeojiensis TaxID=2710754 RepID=UPI00240F15A3|nr:hypothetical protein [Rhodococcus sp. D2-41]MDG3012150.1 hypothetical protein [Rhodococcus sp. D2-41]
MDPFATPDDVEATWRPLSAVERSWAGLLLTAAALWIRGRKPGIDAADPAAKIVSIGVVRSALERNQFEGRGSWSKTVGPRTESGAAADPTRLAEMLDFTESHLQLLGLWKPTGPRAFFGDRSPGVDPIRLPRTYRNL